MKQALHHPKLNEVLATCFSQIDNIEKEYRDFHDRNLALSKDHPSIIDTLYLAFERILAEAFELLSLDAKKSLEDRNYQRAVVKAEKLIGNQLSQTTAKPTLKYLSVL